MPKDNLIWADDFAENYDKSIVNEKWQGPNILFQMINKYINEKGELLDLGIGTGESSKPFLDADLNITGIDGSKKMIEQCRLKNFTSKLIQHNLEKSPLPVTSCSFDYIISHALFHLIDPVKPLIIESFRILKPGGYFGFTFEDSENTKDYRLKEPGIWETKTKSGVWSFKHDQQYIFDLLNKTKFRIIKHKRFLAFTNEEDNTKFYFTAIVVQKPF